MLATRLCPAAGPEQGLQSAAGKGVKGEWAGGRQVLRKAGGSRKSCALQGSVSCPGSEPCAGCGVISTKRLGLCVSQGVMIDTRLPVSFGGRTPDVPRDSCPTEAALGGSDAFVIVSHPLETPKELSSLSFPLRPRRPGR